MNSTNQTGMKLYILQLYQCLKLWQILLIQT